MNIYQSQLDKYVFDLPLIGLVSFTNDGLSHVRYKNITHLNGDKILVTYRELSEITEEIRMNRIPLQSFSSFLVRKMGEYLSDYFDKIEESGTHWLNFVKELLIDPDLVEIFDAYIKTAHLNYVAEVARKKGLDFIARSYEEELRLLEEREKERKKD